jgi:hypothetical protein
MNKMFSHHHFSTILSNRIRVKTQLFMGKKKVKTVVVNNSNNLNKVNPKQLNINQATSCGVIHSGFWLGIGT